MWDCPQGESSVSAQEWVHYDEMVVDVTSAFLEAPPPTHSYFLSFLCLLLSYTHFSSLSPLTLSFPTSLSTSPLSLFLPLPSALPVSHIYTHFSVAQFLATNV